MGRNEIRGLNSAFKRVNTDGKHRKVRWWCVHSKGSVNVLDWLPVVVYEIRYQDFEVFLDDKILSKGDVRKEVCCALRCKILQIHMVYCYANGD
jgi:hypothetical protein